MAESVKFKDGRYIDADDVYDFEQKKTQKDINKTLFHISTVKTMLLENWQAQGTVSLSEPLKNFDAILINITAHNSDSYVTNSLYMKTQDFRVCTDDYAIGVVTLSGYATFSYINENSVKVSSKYTGTFTGEKKIVVRIFGFK